MSILRSLTAPERRYTASNQDWGSSRIPTNGEVGRTAAGMQVNTDQVLSIAAAYTCVAIIADAISSLPLKAYSRTQDHSNIPLNPIPPLIVNPWPDRSRESWVNQVMVSLLIRGNAFGYIGARDDRGYPTAIQILDPDTVAARMVEGQREYRIGGRVIPTSSIMHVAGMTKPGSFIGLDPVTYMATSFGLSLAAEAYGASFFNNSAQPSGVLETPEDLSERETLELARAWRSSHQGVGRGQLPAVLTGGVTWRQLQLAPETAQFLGSRNFSAAEICAWFRVPPHLGLGSADRTTSWGIGVESMSMSFQQYTLGPWMVKLESQLNDYLPPEQTVKFDLTDMVRAPSLERFQRYTLARNGGILSINEIRAMEDLPAIPESAGGDDHMAPLNFAPVDSPVFQDPALSSGGIGGGMDQSPAKGASDAAGE